MSLERAGSQPRRKGPVGRAAAGVLLLALAGCGRPGSGVYGTQRIESNGGHYRITLLPAPDPIPRGLPFDVLVTVEPKGASRGPLEVLIDARMPEHFHGMNRLCTTRRVDPTSWRGEGLLFHMPGHWELDIDISEEGRTERAQWDLVLK